MWLPTFVYWIASSCVGFLHIFCDRHAVGLGSLQGHMYGVLGKHHFIGGFFLNLPEEVEGCLSTLLCPGTPVGPLGENLRIWILFQC